MPKQLNPTASPMRTRSGVSQGGCVAFRLILPTMTGDFTMRMLVLTFMLFCCNSFAHGQDLGGQDLGGRDIAGGAAVLMRAVTDGRVKVVRRKPTSPGVPQVNALLQESNMHLSVLFELGKNRSIPEAYTQ